MCGNLDIYIAWVDGYELFWMLNSGAREPHIQAAIAAMSHIVTRANRDAELRRTRTIKHVSWLRREALRDMCPRKQWHEALVDIHLVLEDNGLKRLTRVRRDAARCDRREEWQ